MQVASLECIGKIMKAFVGITKSKDGLRMKFSDYNTEAEADAFVATAHPDAFVVPAPGTKPWFWKPDWINKTVDNGQADADADALESNWDELRKDRNALLVSSDWTQGADSPLADGVTAEWAVHREALRDLPANTPDPANPTWPDAPS